MADQPIAAAPRPAMTRPVLPPPPPKRWAVLADPDPAEVAQLRAAMEESARAKAAAKGAAAAGLSYNTLFYRLLVQRGMRDVASARDFLQPTLSMLHDPMRMKGMGEMVERLVAARERGDKIAIHGDYDMDGLCSTALLSLALKDLGIDNEPFVPHRMKDGYGVSVRALREWHARGFRVLLTCDTGSSAIKSILEAVDDLGFEVLVTDHHLPPNGELPKAHALVNPHQPGCDYPFKSLCGAGVAFKVLQALARRLNLPGLDESTLLTKYFDLVAIPTVTDVVSLTDENRVLVHFGTQQLRVTQNLGLKAIMERAGITPDKVSASDFGFKIGPRFNAAGRIADAGLGLDLLLAETQERANEIGDAVEAINLRRRDIQNAIEASAVRMVEAMDLSDVYGLVLFGPEAGELAPDGTPEVEWHHGVVGVVASRMVERYGRPCLLLAKDEKTQMYKGSGRAPTGVGTVSLKAAIDHVKDTTDLVEAGGGHAAAAGITLAAKVCTPEAKAAFASAFNDAVRPMLPAEERTPRLVADLETTLDQFTPVLGKTLRRFEPFGMGNPAMRFIVRQAEVVSARAMKEVHLELQVRHPGMTEPLRVIMWSGADQHPELLRAGAPRFVDLYVEFAENTFRGQTKYELKCTSLRIAEPPLWALEAPGLADGLARDPHEPQARVAAALAPAPAPVQMPAVAPAAAARMADGPTALAARRPLMGGDAPRTTATAASTRGTVGPITVASPAPAAPAVRPIPLSDLSDDERGSADMTLGAGNATPSVTTGSGTPSAAAAIARGDALIAAARPGLQAPPMFGEQMDLLGGVVTPVPAPGTPVRQTGGGTDADMPVPSGVRAGFCLTAADLLVRVAGHEEDLRRAPAPGWQQPVVEAASPVQIGTPATAAAILAGMRAIRTL